MPCAQGSLPPPGKTGPSGARPTLMGLTRFLHTADWHLGMTRRFLPPEAQARYSEDRIDAVGQIARMADEVDAQFVLVCGDVFDSNHVDRQVVARAASALAQFTVPVLILPGNHDPLDAASVYRAPAFVDRLPASVTVIEDSTPILIGDVEVVGAPWNAKRPGLDPSASVVAGLGPAGSLRVLAAHGVVDVMSPDTQDPSVIAMSGLRTALDAGLLAYVALGDRHSTTEVGGDPRVWYPGTPVATDHGELDPGNVLVVTVDGLSVSVAPRRVGQWSFRRIEARLDGVDDVLRLDAELAAIADKRRTIVRLSLVGALTLSEDAELHRALDDHADVFASLTTSDGRSDLALMVEEGDLQHLGLQGYAHAAAAEIAEAASIPGPDQQAARDALRLLYRLTRGPA